MGENQMPDYIILIVIGVAIIAAWTVLFKKCYIDRDCSCPECGYDDAVAEIVAYYDMRCITKYTCEKCDYVWDVVI